MRKRILLIVLGIIALIPCVAFAAANYTVSFETYGGTAIQPVVKEWNRPYGEMPVPEKEGSVFYGWYTEPEFENEFDRNTLVLQDITLHAKYIPAANLYKKINVKVIMPKVGTVIEEVEESPLHGRRGPSAVPEFVIDPSEGLEAYGFIVDPTDGDYFYGTLEADTEYIVQLVVVVTDDNHLFADDLDLKTNFPLWRNYLDLNGRDFACALSTLATTDYNIVSGGDATYNGEDLVITSDGLLHKLLGIRFDDEDLDEANYSLTEGSTILTLKASFLNTVKPGKHKVTFVYTDGEVDTYITIPETENPKTGDFIHIYVLTLIMSSFGLLTIRKRLN